MSESTTSRRRFLELGGTAAIAALAGCSFATSGSGDTTTGPGPAAGESPGSDADSPTPSAAPSATAGSPSSAGESTGTAASTEYTRLYESAIDSVVLVRMGQGQGTGFMFDDSTVVTNAHVVGQATGADVRFSDGQWRSGEVAGSDRHSDLAAITVDDAPSSASPLPFDDSEPVVGQEVVAIGNPYNLNGSLTTGIVSGVDRLIPSPTGYRIPDAVQTDAAVNPGNSGGPLMSLDERIVAVINSGGGDNIAFGISAALTQRVVPRLVETGEYDHAHAGVSLTDVTPTIAQANDLPESRGLLVVQVSSGGPADGVLQGSEVQFSGGRRLPVGGDVVLAIDGRDLATTEDLWSYLALEKRPGETVELTVLRDGSEQTVSFELGTRPENTGA